MTVKRNNLRQVDAQSGVHGCMPSWAFFVLFTYSMAWLMDGKSFREQGKELYVLTKENDNWLIVLRKLVASDSQ